MYKRHATLFFVLCFLGGIFASAFLNLDEVYKFSWIFHITQYYFLGFFILGLVLAQILGGGGGKRLSVLIMVLITGFFGGALIYQNSSREQIISAGNPNHISYYNDKGEMTFTGKIIYYPDFKIDKTKYEMEALAPFSGKILITANRYPLYEYGDILELTGKLKTPAEFPDFNYKNYLSKDGIYSVIYWPQVDKIGEAEGLKMVFWKNIFSFRTKMRDGFYKIFPASQASVLAAMILGDEHLMSEELVNKLSATGLRHIVAISGFNIFILIRILEHVGFRIGLWRQRVFYFVLVVITIYIFLVGASASVVRAGIMGIVALLAGHIGRVIDPKRAVIFTATGMLALNPFLLRLDIGFQLSFLAILGIMYLESYFERWLRFLPKDLIWKLFPLRSVAAMTLAAQTATLPVVIYNFGTLSLISPVINVLVVPLLTVITPFAIAVGIGGIFLAPIFLYFSWPLYIMLSYILLMIDIFSKIPMGFLRIQGDFSFLWFTPWYLGIFWLIRRYKIV